MTPEQKQENLRVAREILGEQNFSSALVFGVLAMLFAIAIWALAVALTGRTVGVMAVALGAAVGYAIQFFGKGIEARFAVLAGSLALLGTLLGSIIAAFLREILVFGLSLSEIPDQLASGPLLKWVLADIDFLSMAFWILSVSAAAYIANRRLSHSQALALFAYRYADPAQQGN